jgi:2-C-methyl-D-erythritol 4-phosphate cytidylyltransferase
LLDHAYEAPYTPIFTDDASVVEALGEKIHLVEGERSNLKLTTRDDFIIAEALLTAQQTPQEE